MTAVAVILAATPLLAADLYITWDCVLDGSLGSGASASFSGSTTLGGDTIHNIYGDFYFPDAVVGNGTGRAFGTVTVTCDVTAPEGVLLHDLTVYRLGQLDAGEHALDPYIAWTELLLDITDPDNPVTLVSDSGVDYTQPESNYYTFTPTRYLRIKETFTLDGVTYVNDQGETVVDDTALASLLQIQKDLSVIPEPSSIAALSVGLLGLLGVLRRRK